MTLPERLPLDTARLGSPPVPFTSIRVVETSPSTNAELLAAAASSQTGTVLVAEHQTAGLGRLGRVWQSPARSGLTVSVLLRPQVPVADWGWLPLLTGVAVHDTVAELGVPAALKWPNDLLLGDDERKAGGILSQVHDDAVVIGIGLNVSLTFEELPVPEATSLTLAGATGVDRTELLLSLLANLGRRYREWSEAAGDAERAGLAGAYRDRCATLGRTVTVAQMTGGVLSGEAVGIDGDGRLLVRAGDRDVAVAAGDVQHVRPA